MSELNTKGLIELDVLEELQETDHVLIESDGMMKRINGSMVGGNNNIGVCVINLSEYEDKIYGENSDPPINAEPFPSQGGNVL